jgi:hypothetical protein
MDALRQNSAADLLDICCEQKDGSAISDFPFHKVVNDGEVSDTKLSYEPFYRISRARRLKVST